jgi:ATP-dependent Clp protease adaptor protein ClpS
MGRAEGALAEEVREDLGLDSGWRVTLFNCDCHTFDQVERALVKATRCSLSQARAWSWEVHTKGSAVVYRGARERCEAVAEVIGAVGLVTSVSQ